jgi:hypothetical protein
VAHATHASGRARRAASLLGIVELGLRALIVDQWFARYAEKSGGRFWLNAVMRR